MKKLTYIGFLLLSIAAMACPACEKQQPELLKGISHGTGPTGNSDYVIIIATAIIVVVTFIYFIKYTFFPGERSVKHIYYLNKMSRA